MSQQDAPAARARPLARGPKVRTAVLAATLRELARSLVRFLNSPLGKVVAAVTLSDAARIPRIAEVRRRFVEDRFDRAGPVVSGAIPRPATQRHRPRRTCPGRCRPDLPAVPGHV